MRKHSARSPDPDLRRLVYLRTLRAQRRRLCLHEPNHRLIPRCPVQRQHPARTERPTPSHRRTQRQRGIGRRHRRLLVPRRRAWAWAWAAAVFLGAWVVDIEPLRELDFILPGRFSATILVSCKELDRFQPERRGTSR